MPWIGGAIGGGVLLMLLARSGFHLESRRRRHAPVLQEPTIGQVRRDNATARVRAFFDRMIRPR